MSKQEEIYEYFDSLRLRREGRLEEAVDMYRERLKANPRDNKTRWDLAVTLSQCGKDVDALRECRSIVEAEPDNYTFRMTLVKQLLKQKLWKEALSEGEALVRLRPNLAAPHSYVGDAYKGLSDLTSAIRAYELATTLRGVMPDMFRALGELYEKAGRIQDSLNAFRKAGKAPAN